MLKIKVPVLSTHIQNGRCGCEENCALAMAISDAFVYKGFYNPLVEVNSSTIRVSGSFVKREQRRRGFSYGTYDFTFDMSRKLKRFIHRFDHYGEHGYSRLTPPKPFAFTLTLE